MPPRLDSVRWIVIAGFGAMFLLGAFFLWMRSRNLAAVAGSASVPASALPVAAAPMASPVAALGASPENREDVLRHSVDEIKETLFRLELRRQAGTLPEAD